MKEIQIGSQVWMNQNLNINNFKNGDIIPEIQSIEGWIAAGENEKPACCNYNNETYKGIIYGKLYNWYALNDIRGLAPKGWKIPSDEDWNQLIDFLGGWEIAGKKIKDSSILQSSLGFNGVHGGARDSLAQFFNIIDYSYWWTSTENSNYTANYRSINKNSDSILRNFAIKSFGFSVRCIKIE